KARKAQQETESQPVEETASQEPTEDPKKAAVAAAIARAKARKAQQETEILNLLQKQLLKSQPKIRRKPQSLLLLLVQKREKLNKTRIKIIPRRTSNVVFYCQFTACA
uniref:hypothetical protein n=1 Tax=Vibrio parahaemolyticus TaxID=670 RepID=UPI002270E4C3